MKASGAPPVAGSAGPDLATPTAAPAPRAAPRPELLDLLFGEGAPATAPPPSADPFGAPAGAVASPADPFAVAAAAAAAGGARRPADPFAPRARHEGAPDFPPPGPGPFPSSPPAAGGAGAQVEERAPAAPPTVERSEVALLTLPRRSLAARLARPKVAVPVAAALAVAAVAGVVAQRRAVAVEAAFAAELSAADARVQAGRLAAPAGDSALDHLDAARTILPADPRLAARARVLADTFEDLGRRALGRGDLREAAAHFRGALRAEPARRSAQAQLETIARIEPRRPGAPR